MAKQNRPRKWKLQPRVKLLVQPEDGLEPILQAMEEARESLEVLIFRLDAKAVERALVTAARRGVVVKVLLPHRRRAEAKPLRRLETRLRAAGVEVARSADDLRRYHGKMLIVDGRTLYVFTFNFTRRDMAGSRSFAAKTTVPQIVAEARRLFAADVQRTAYVALEEDLLVSPSNARERLGEFLDGATTQLLIYEMQLSDRQFLTLLRAKVKAGVEVRVLARRPLKKSGLAVRRSPMRLHARAIVRDGEAAFLGSMSLRRLELDNRREVGLIFDDPETVRRLAATFEQDWAAAAPLRGRHGLAEALRGSTSRIGKLVRERRPWRTVLQQLTARPGKNR